jgi:hypothetical protein
MADIIYPGGPRVHEESVLTPEIYLLTRSRFFLLKITSVKADN